MAQFVDPQELDEITEAIAPAIELARALAEAKALIPADATPEQDALHVETQALVFVVQAALLASPLTDSAAFVALGSALGVVMAQSSEPHAELWRLARRQLQLTYDDVMASTAPQGSA